MKSGGPKGFERRETLRNTWIKFFNVTQACYFFALSKHESKQDQEKIEEEKIKYKDIVVFEHLAERYELLTYKTYEILKHSSRNYKFTWLTMLDDDCILNIFILDKYSANKWKNESFFGGLEVGHSQVITDTNHKNHELNYKDCQHYPPYVSGGTVTLSSDIVKWAASSSLPLRMLNNEDAAMGVWFASLNNSRVVMTDGIVLHSWIKMQDFSRKPMDYFIIKDISTKHQMYEVWNVLENNKL